MSLGPVRLCELVPWGKKFLPHHIVWNHIVIFWSQWNSVAYFILKIRPKVPILWLWQPSGTYRPWCCWQMMSFPLWGRGSVTAAELRASKPPRNISHFLNKWQQRNKTEKSIKRGGEEEEVIPSAGSREEESLSARDKAVSSVIFLCLDFFFSFKHQNSLLITVTKWRLWFLDIWSWIIPSKLCVKSSDHFKTTICLVIHSFFYSPVMKLNSGYSDRVYCWNIWLKTKPDSWTELWLYINMWTASSNSIDVFWFHLRLKTDNQSLSFRLLMSSIPIRTSPFGFAVMWSLEGAAEAARFLRLSCFLRRVFLQHQQLQLGLPQGMSGRLGRDHRGGCEEGDRSNLSPECVEGKISLDDSNLHFSKIISVEMVHS